MNRNIVLDSPDNQRLATTTVASSEHTYHIGGISLVGVCVSQQAKWINCQYTLAGVCIFDLPSCFTPRALITSLSGPKNPSAKKTSCAGKNLSEPGTSSIFHLPLLSFVHSTRTV